VPNTNGGDTAVINAAAEYVAGGDLPFHSGGGLVINSGGSWTQTGGVSWIQAAGGSIVVNGGSFNQGTAGNIIRDASTVITINTGSATFNGNYTYNPVSSGAFNLNGGTATFTGEFQLGAPFVVSGATLASRLFVFGGSNVLTITSGMISTDGAALDGGNNPTNGFYAISPTSYVNLTSLGTGVYFRNFSSAQLTTAGWLTNGAIKYQGSVNPGIFQVVEQGGGVMVTAVPEPSTYAVAIGIGCFGLIYLRRRKMGMAS